MLGEKDRDKMLLRLADPFAYLSGHIPDVVVFAGEPFRLKEFIKHQKGKTDYRERDLKAIAWVLGRLEEAIKAAKASLEDGEGLTRETAEALVDRTLGLVRARVLLGEMVEGQDLDPVDVDREKELEDVRRWMDYSKKIG